MVHTLLWIFMSPMLTECFLFFRLLWLYQQNSMVGDLPLEHICLHPYSLLWILTLAVVPLLILPVLTVMLRTLLLMNFPYHFPSRIMWHFCIVTSCNTPTSSLIGDFILKIGTATFWTYTCVPHEVYWYLIQRTFSVHCNQISPWNLFPTNAF